MNSDDAGNDGISLELKACRVCGRTFLPSALDRHENICEKASTKQRKVFDSFKQRAKGSGVLKTTPEKQEEVKKPKQRWKEQHEELIQIIRADKEIDKTVGSSTPIYTPRKYISLGYTRCPVCNRCFNQKAADRHISWCQEQKSRLPKTPASSEATERLKARINYRAPLPANKKKSLHEDLSPPKSARSCQSALVTRLHSSASPLSEISSLHKLHGNNNTNGSLGKKNNEKQSPTKRTQQINYLNNQVTGPSYKLSTPHISEVPVVKFKEKFPYYNAQRVRINPEEIVQGKDEGGDFNLLKSTKSSLCSMSRTTLNSEKSTRRNCFTPASGLSDNSDDLLNMLRKKLADVGHYEDLTERFNLGQPVVSQRKTYTEGLPEVSSSEMPPFIERDSWTSDGDTHLSTSSSSDGSFPPLSRGGSSGGRMPRFCYQCGTKYPIASAKYCCECGARRLVFSVKDIT